MLLYIVDRKTFNDNDREIYSNLSNVYIHLRMNFIIILFDEKGEFGANRDRHILWSNNKTLNTGRRRRSHISNSVTDRQARDECAMSCLLTI